MDKQHYVLLGFEGEVLAIVAGRHEAELKTYTRKAVAERFQEPVNKFKVTKISKFDVFDYRVTVVGPQGADEEKEYFLINSTVYSK